MTTERNAKIKYVCNDCGCEMSAANNAPPEESVAKNDDAVVCRKCGSHNLKIEVEF